MKTGKIAALLDINIKTVIKWRNRSSTSDLSRDKSSLVLTPEAKDEIASLCRDQWGMSTRKLTKFINQCGIVGADRTVSRRTVQRHVRSTDWGRVAYRVQIKPLLSGKNIRDRQAFCQKMISEGYCGGTSLSEQLLGNILFTDESIIELYPKPNRQNMRVRTSDPTALQPLMIPKNGLKIMVAGGISANGITQLVIVDQNATVDGEYYRTRILPSYFSDISRPSGCDLINQRRMFTDARSVVFMQDGAPAHTANATMAMLAEHFTTVWSRNVWPGNSPDLNPIEHIWAIIKDSVFEDPRPRTREDLVVRVTQAWNSLPLSFIQRLVYSFPSRIRACQTSNGGPTRY